MRNRFGVLDKHVFNNTAGAARPVQSRATRVWDRTDSYVEVFEEKLSVSKSVLPIIGQRAKKRDLYKYKRAHI